MQSITQRFKKATINNKSNVLVKSQFQYKINKITKITKTV